MSLLQYILVFLSFLGWYSLFWVKSLFRFYRNLYFSNRVKYRYGCGKTQKKKCRPKVGSGFKKFGKRDYPEKNPLQRMLYPPQNSSRPGRDSRPGWKTNVLELSQYTLHSSAGVDELHLLQWGSAMKRRWKICRAHSWRCRNIAVYHCASYIYINTVWV